MRSNSSILACSTVAALALAGVAGCRHTIAVEPIEVRPIHLTLDINLKVDRELDSFFDFEPYAHTPSPAAPASSGESTTPGGQS